MGFTDHRSAVIREYVKAVAVRAMGSVCNSPFMSDQHWQTALEIVHQKGPLGTLEMIAYSDKHHSFARAHLLDLVLELELAYTVIKELSERENA